jgi:hypothetical protein
MVDYRQAVEVRLLHRQALQISGLDCRSEQRTKHEILVTVLQVLVEMASQAQNAIAASWRVGFVPSSLPAAQAGARSKIRATLSAKPLPAVSSESNTLRRTTGGMLHNA